MEATTAQPGSNSAIFLGLAAFFVVLLHQLCQFAPDPREPPTVHPRIPYVGHALGMLFQGKRYIRMLDEKHGYGIYTLPVLRWRLYIITSPSMAAAINRVPKNLSFRPIQVDLVQCVGGLPAQTDKINRVNLMDEEAEGVMTAIHEVIYSMVPSGPGLEKLTQAVINQVTQNFGGLPSGKFDTGLYEFCKHMIGAATIRALYGQDTPLDHPSLISDYWEFDEGLLALLLSPLPSITHRKPHAARERLARLLVAYFEGGHDAKACDMMRARFTQYRKHGYSTEGLARTELCFIVGAVSNTTITAFWFLARILADASIVDELRAEITAGALDAERHRDGEGAAAATFKVAALRSPAACPLLNSVFRETLRLASTTTGSRQVLADTAVGDERYLLKRGAFVSVEGSVLHYKHAYWGPDAARFNARRFVCSSSAGTRLDGGKVHPGAWRAFGGGDVLCPGRNLAQNEILAVAAAVLLGFDVGGAGGEKEAVVIPEVRDDTMPVGVLRPASDIDVRFAPRAGWEGVCWKYRA